MQLLPLVSLTAALKSVVRYKLGSSHKGMIGFGFVHGVFFCLFVDEDLFPHNGKSFGFISFSLLLHFFFILEVFLRIELGQQKFCQKLREPLVRKQCYVFANEKVLRI